MAVDDSLYRRIGGYDVLAAVVDCFLSRLLGDSAFRRFVGGMNHERQQRNRQLTLDFLVHATGGPALYLGQDMRTAHRGLAITSSEWDLAADHFRVAMEDMQLPAREAGELLAVFDSSREDIVEESQDHAGLTR